MRVNEVEKSENYQEMAAEVERKLCDEMERWERRIVSGNFLVDRRPSVVIGDLCVRGKLDRSNLCWYFLHFCPTKLPCHHCIYSVLPQ